MTHFRTNCLENARHFLVSDEILRQLFLERTAEKGSNFGVGLHCRTRSLGRPEKSLSYRVTVAPFIKFIRIIALMYV